MLVENGMLNPSPNRKELLNKCMKSRDQYGCNVLWYAINKGCIPLARYIMAYFEVPLLPDYVSISFQTCYVSKMIAHYCLLL
jgi:hypothetical protein